MRRIVGLCTIALIALGITGCVTSRDLSYLVDMVPETPYDVTPNEDLKLQKGDRLTITVFSDAPELTAPFNLTAGGSIEDTKEKSATLPYRIDNLGQINFPIIGNVDAEGRTIAEVEDEIQRKIARSGYIKDPKINVKLDNFIITVLGVSGNSVMTMDRDDVNLLQVIAMVGGTRGQEARIKDVAVIRTENGKRTMHEVNLQSKDLFDSPVFYMQQNDIVYIRPRGGQISRLASNTMSVFSMGVSIVSVITSLLLLASSSN